MDRLAELLTSPKVAIAVLGPIFGLMLIKGCVEMAPSDEQRRRG